jgi:hypothetical protein
MSDAGIMRIPVPVLAGAIVALLLLALAAGSTRVRAEPNLARGNVEDCAGRLAEAGIMVERAAHPARTGSDACVVVDPVALISVSDPALPERRIRFADRPLLSCAMAERLARFTADMAAPLALGVFGKELSAVATGPGYECRPRNRQPGAKLSSHGQGNAADVMAFELHGGRRIAVERAEDAESARFITAFRSAACGAFTTVLGPGSDAAHGNHVHVDIEPRGRDGRSRLCQ